MNKIKRNWKKLEIEYKIIGFGSFLGLLSCFLPWYQDILNINKDKAVGDMFLGVTGPAYFIGILIFLFTSISFTLFLTHLFRFHVPKFSFDEGTINVFLGIQCFLFLGIAASMYLHSKFGVNITNKEIKYGMLISFLGISLMVIGGLKLKFLILNNISQKQDFITQKIANLVGNDLNVQEKPKPNLSTEDFNQPLEQLLKKHEMQREYNVNSFYKPSENIVKDKIIDKVHLNK